MRLGAGTPRLSGMDPVPSVRRFHTDPADLPILRMIVGVGRGGSTALLRAFASHSQVAAVYQPVQAGQRVLGRPDYRIYARHPVFEVHPGKAFVAKETPSTALKAAPIDVFPYDAAVRRVRPVFLFRDPFASWSSLRRLIPGGLDPFVAAYRHAIALYERACMTTDSGASCLTLEHLCDHPEAVLRTICRRWGLTYEPSMLVWTRPLEHQMVVFDHDRRAMRDTPASTSTARTSRTFGHSVAPVEMSRGERRTIAEQLAERFESLHRDAQAMFPFARPTVPMAASQGIGAPSGGPG